MKRCHIDNRTQKKDKSKIHTLEVIGIEMAFDPLEWMRSPRCAMRTGALSFWANYLTALPLCILICKMEVKVIASF